MTASQRCHSRLHDAGELGLKLPGNARAVGLLTCTSDDALYVALDEATKNAPVDVLRVIDVSIRMAYSAVKHRARLERDYRQVTSVEGNESRLGQVFLNLLMNAAQSITEGAADRNEIRVVTRTDRRGRAVIEVHDTGSGIPDEIKTRIFAPFFHSS